MKIFGSAKLLRNFSYFNVSQQTRFVRGSTKGSLLRGHCTWLCCLPFYLLYLAYLVYLCTYVTTFCYVVVYLFVTTLRVPFFCYYVTQST